MGLHGSPPFRGTAPASPGIPPSRPSTRRQIDAYHTVPADYGQPRRRGPTPRSGPGPFNPAHPGLAAPPARRPIPARPPKVGRAISVGFRPAAAFGTGGTGREIESRVEVWRGGSVASARLRFHTPLIKLDRQFSRIQLSDKAVLIAEFTRSRTKPLRLAPLESVESQLLVQVGVGVSCLTLTRYLELRAQPLADPEADVTVDAAVRRADSSDAEVVGPAA